MEPEKSAPGKSDSAQLATKLQEVSLSASPQSSLVTSSGVLDRSKIILPEKGKVNRLITSAIPYVNNVPHLGNLIGSILSADVFARYCRLRGYNTIYICGNDEYGTATETKAMEEKTTPQALCDKYHAIHKEVYDWFDISFDYFGRTTTQRQTEIAQDIFLKLHKNGKLVEQTSEQLFCNTCSRFLADRFVEGICPHCAAPGARGDQCDTCSKLINAVELVNPYCITCKSTPTVKSTNHFYINLPLLEKNLEEWINKSSTEGKWSENSIAITKAWLKKGLEPRCITRDLKWGTPVPLPGWENKVFYVWFDAPIGYISITATYTDQWRSWWKKDAETGVKLYQFMGKDNIPFHTVIFPATLIGTEEDWTRLHHLSTTEFLNYESGKFSKSRKTGVFGTDAHATGIPAEVWRFYLLYNRPESADASFSWDDFLACNNSLLLDKIGNLTNRILKFVDANFSKTIPANEQPSDKDKTLIEKTNGLLKEYIDNLEESKSLRDGLKVVLSISTLGNIYLQEEAPWVSIKNNKPRCGSVIYTAANLVHLLATLLSPFIPSFSSRLLTQLNISIGKITDTWEFKVPSGHVIGTPEPLVKKLEMPAVNEIRKKFAGKPNFILDIRIGKIVSVKDHPTATSLYLIDVDIGDEKEKDGGIRRVVAGLKGKIPIEELQGREVPILLNLKPAKIQGENSNGMLLIAEKANQIHLLDLIDETGVVQSNSARSFLGKKINAEGHQLAPRGGLDHKKEFSKIVLTTTDKPIPGIAQITATDQSNHLLVLNDNEPKLYLASIKAANGAKIK